MKAILKVILVMITLLVINSCADDEKDEYKTPESLVGTTWKCDLITALNADLEYISLKFISETKVEAWTKYKDEEFKREWTGTYLINGKNITIQATELNQTFTGTINGVTMSMTLMEGIGPFVFNLQ